MISCHQIRMGVAAWPCCIQSKCESIEKNRHRGLRLSPLGPQWRNSLCFRFCTDMGAKLSRLSQHIAASIGVHLLIFSFRSVPLISAAGLAWIVKSVRLSSRLCSGLCESLLMLLCALMYVCVVLKQVKFQTFVLMMFARSALLWYRAFRTSVDVILSLVYGPSLKWCFSYIKVGDGMCCRKRWPSQRCPC